MTAVSSTNICAAHKAVDANFIRGAKSAAVPSGRTPKSGLFRPGRAPSSPGAHDGRCWPLCLSGGRRVLRPRASTEDGVAAVNGVPSVAAETSGGGEAEEMRARSDESPGGEDLVQVIHDAARALELAIQEHVSSSRGSWFSKNWLGVDNDAWIKTLSYQAAVYSLLQAIIEISSRGDGRDRGVNVSVQRRYTRRAILKYTKHVLRNVWSISSSFLDLWKLTFLDLARGVVILYLLFQLQRLVSESTIRDQLSNKNTLTSEWFWSHQHPMVVTTFVNLFEKDLHFPSATIVCWKGESSTSGTTCDLAFIMLALSCLAAIMKLGAAKVSCTQFMAIIPDITGRLMDMLFSFMPISKAYSSMKDIGMHREFLLHFGPRAAPGKSENASDIEEITFWVDLIQRKLQQAIDREKIWSRLTTCESIEVLEKDLAIFGFFIALGRSTQSFLSSNGLTMSNEQIEGIIRYLIGGSVLYYPQLSSISSYQLYVEVVCEELEWLPFYQSDLLKTTPDKRDKREGMSEQVVVSQVLNVCLFWITSFIKHSTWLENPSHIKAARFLSRGHSMLKECMEELGMLKGKKKRDDTGHQLQGISEGTLSAGAALESFDKALESVEEALNKLEDLLQELHLANSNLGKENLRAACSDLERIRKLKKEAEFLEASFRAKAASLEQGEAGGSEQLRIQEDRRLSGEDSTSQNLMDVVVGKPRGFWSSLVRGSTKRIEPGQLIDDANGSIAQSENQVSESNEISRFELLRNELIELEKRVQRSTDGSQSEEKLNVKNGEDDNASAKESLVLVKPPKEQNIIAKSMEKIKETSTDILQGTQLLAIDVSAAVVLLKRSVTGDELTQKEKKALQRTLTDLASVIPIGVLMLLPLTAVGHAAILAFIQRYVPAMIPSTYAPERLDLLRQLEKVKEMETGDMSSDRVTDSASVGTSRGE